MPSHITHHEAGVRRHDWRVRPYKDADTEGLLTLYRQVFGRERTEAEFRWKLLREDAPADTLWVADAGGHIVGQHGGVPMRIKLGDKEVQAMHAVEAMTHTAHRREGMLTTLGGALYAHWQQQGVPLVIGLPHEGWGTRAYALGYRPAFPMRWLSRPLRPVSILLSVVQSPKSQTMDFGLWTTDDRKTSSIVHRPSSRGNIIVQPQESAGADFDRLWREIRGSYANAVVRDEAWVKWRYFDPPDAPYTVLLAERHGAPCGYIAYRITDLGRRRIGRIADLCARSDDSVTARALLRAATTDLRNRGADSAVILVAVGSPLFSTVRRNGFLLNRGEYQASFIRLSEDVDEAALNNPRNWLLTGGDFDVV